MTPVATRVTQNLQSRYARLRRGCWRLLRANATLRGQLALTEATATMTLRVSVDLAAELRERNARIAELEAQQAAASQPERRWRDAVEELPPCHDAAMSRRVEVITQAKWHDYLKLWTTSNNVVAWRPLEGGESDENATV